ncbi:hypothetical protein VTK73DRAFT_7310 [Phialemonium thermophilum]|uniref:Gag1-like clamp domain-containing protein n=1 Tax=Phialemonium thermophilum TaxID=223376 RepID=A0ABR3WF23_9PEZI
MGQEGGHIKPSLSHEDAGGESRLETSVSGQQHSAACKVGEKTKTQQQQQQYHHQDQHQKKMLFSDLYKSPKSPLSKLRHSHVQPAPVGSLDYHADLVSKDKTRQKEAVKRYLAEKVRNDWHFSWPPLSSRTEGKISSASEHGLDSEMAVGLEADGEGSLKAHATTSNELLEAHAGADSPAAELTSLPTSPAPFGGVVAPAEDSGEEADSESDAKSVYSTISEDTEHYRNRAEWVSDLSDEELPETLPSYLMKLPSNSSATEKARFAGKARRRRELREEATWNEGLACFTARRDAWTGARTVRVKPKPPTPVSQSPPRRLFRRTHSRTESNPSSPTTTPASLSAVMSAPTPVSSLSPTTSRLSDRSLPMDRETGTTSPSEPDSNLHKGKQQRNLSYPVETVIPIPPPLLPAQNPMRASIIPSIYPSLYDKVVVKGLQPSCPINLSDMVRACVVGWKRDGEWPPRPAPLDPFPSRTAAAAATVVVVRRKEKKPSAISTTTGAPPNAAQGEIGTHSRKNSTTGGGGSGRRMSFAGFMEMVSGERDKDKDKEGKEGKEDEGATGSTGKGIRRSLQKVLSFGHSHSNSPGGPPQSPPVPAADEKVAPIQQQDASKVSG